MVFCKSLAERINEIKGASPYSRECQLLGLLDFYSESFSRPKAMMYFLEIPSEIIWRGNYTFFVVNQDERVVFKPETISDFISVCESLGFMLQPNINLNEEDDLTISINKRLKWSI